MNRKSYLYKSKWIERPVDVDKQHIKLSYGNEYLPMALLQPWKDNVISVHFLMPRNGVTGNMVTEALREMDFYLNEHHASDPWEYARHRCSNDVGLHSAVHWQWFEELSSNRHPANNEAHSGYAR